MDITKYKRNAVHVTNNAGKYSYVRNYYVNPASNIDTATQGGTSVQGGPGNYYATFSTSYQTVYPAIGTYTCFGGGQYNETMDVDAWWIE